VQRENRRLAAIVAADIAGYSRLIGRDEEGTLRALRAHRRELVDPKIAEYGGRIANTAGDSLLLEFPSAVDAVRCAIAVQQGMTERNRGTEADRQISFRIGINVGDVIAEGDDLLGDGVNIAARLQEIAEPGGICVSHRALEDVQDRIAVVFDNLGQQSLKNIVRPVTVWRWVADAGGTPAASPIDVSKPVQGFAGRPAIAVLPFDNLSKDEEHEFLADGIAEDILTRLAMWRWLPVIARNSSFIYKGRSVDLKNVGRELGARYVLEGSVRKAGNRVRITGQLIDTDTGHHVWAQRYDRELDDIFALQDEITDAIVAALEPAVGRAEMQRAHRRNPQNLDAWDLYQRGKSSLIKTTREDMQHAIELFRQSSVADPEFASPLAAIAVAEFIKLTVGFNDGAGLSPAAHQAATRAVLLDDLDPFAHVGLGYASAFTGQHDAGILAAQRAIEINPSFALGYHCLAGARFLNGEHNEAAEAAQVAIRISPNDPWLFLFFGVLSASHYMRGDHEQALETVNFAVRRFPWYASTHRWHAVALAQVGRLDEATSALGRFLGLSPNYTLEIARHSYPFRRESDLAHYLDGLRKAGLSE
jgi:adenylate cyclase